MSVGSGWPLDTQSRSLVALLLGMTLQEVVWRQGAKGSESDVIIRTRMQHNDDIRL